MNSKNVETYFSSAREREAIRRRRLAREPYPWTADDVLLQWRFCNVCREDDRTTVWFRERVRNHVSGWRAVEATIAFRWFNRIETGEAVSDLLLEGWDSSAARERLSGVSPVVTGAYIIKTPDGMSKLDGVLWCIDEARLRMEKVWQRWGEALEHSWADLVTCPFMGGFMAYEVVTDLRRTPVLRSATDVDTWANLGPGAQRGLAFLGGAAGDLRSLLSMSRDPSVWPYADRRWEMREVEHWLCEYSKYETGRGGGRLKRRYAAPPDTRFKWL